MRQRRMASPGFLRSRSELDAWDEQWDDDRGDEDEVEDSSGDDGHDPDRSNGSEEDDAFDSRYSSCYKDHKPDGIASAFWEGEEKREIGATPAAAAAVTVTPPKIATATSGAEFSRPESPSSLNRSFQLPLLSAGPYNQSQRRQRGVATSAGASCKGAGSARTGSRPYFFENDHPQHQAHPVAATPLSKVDSDLTSTTTPGKMSFDKKGSFRRHHKHPHRKASAPRLGLLQSAQDQASIPSNSGSIAALSAAGATAAGSFPDRRKNSNRRKNSKNAMSGSSNLEAIASSINRDSSQRPMNVDRQEPTISDDHLLPSSPPAVTPTAATHAPPLPTGSREASGRPVLPLLTTSGSTSFAFWDTGSKGRGGEDTGGGGGGAWAGVGAVAGEARRLRARANSFIGRLPGPKQILLGMSFKWFTLHRIPL